MRLYPSFTVEARIGMSCIRHFSPLPSMSLKYLSQCFVFCKCVHYNYQYD